MAVQNRLAPSFFVVPLIHYCMGFLFVLALLFGQRSLAILTLLILVLVTGVKLWAWGSLSRVNCHLAVDKWKVFPGENLALKISTENAKLLPIWHQIIVPVGSLMQALSGEKELANESSLLWYQRSKFEWQLTAERRGVYQIGPLHIFTGDFFSFFSRHRKTDDFYEIMVYPRLVALKPIMLARRDFFGIPGPRNPIQDPIYTLGTRDYQHGRPSKYIHWKASARYNRLQEKVFESTQQEKILLVVNVDQFMRYKAEEGFERTLEIVASLAVQLYQRGHAVGLVANGRVKGRGSAIVPVARNQHQLSAILEVLARLQMNRHGELKDILRHRLSLAWGISCVYFSFEEDETVSDAKGYFSWRKMPAVFFVCRSHPLPGEENFGVQRKIYRLEDIRA